MKENPLGIQEFTPLLSRLNEASAPEADLEQVPVQSPPWVFTMVGEAPCCTAIGVYLRGSGGPSPVLDFGWIPGRWKHLLYLCLSSTVSFNTVFRTSALMVIFWLFDCASPFPREPSSYSLLLRTLWALADIYLMAQWDVIQDPNNDASCHATHARQEVRFLGSRTESNCTSAGAGSLALGTASQCCASSGTLLTCWHMWSLGFRSQSPSTTASWSLWE